MTLNGRTTWPCPGTPSSPGPLPQGIDAVSAQLAQIAEQLIMLRDRSDNDIDRAEDQALACQQRIDALVQMQATVRALPITTTTFRGSSGSQDSWCSASSGPGTGPGTVATAPAYWLSGGPGK